VQNVSILQYSDMPTRSAVRWLLFSFHSRLTTAIYVYECSFVRFAGKTLHAGQIWFTLHKFCRKLIEPKIEAKNRTLNRAYILNNIDISMNRFSPTEHPNVQYVRGRSKWNWQNFWWKRNNSWLYLLILIELSFFVCPTSSATGTPPLPVILMLLRRILTWGCNFLFFTWNLTPWLIFYVEKLPTFL
jgi:hypothetical protein